MEMKHLIIFAVVGMVALLGFNMMNGNQRDKNREVITASSQPEIANTDTAISENISSNTSNTNNTSDIASQPLGQQPKAILDNATAKIDQAQQADAARLEQTSDAQ
ncbi:hypothetical protein [Psychrobacter glacincola]|uniref:hypothetical protein n=1 Tax=Psychrobacter glacincola TaxID=56810 RepID=UPI0039B11F3E